MNESVETGFRSANESFYRTVDWALDIRECTAESLSILGIPADLIRIDPQRQIRIYRERIESDRQWYDACEGTWWRAGVADLLTSSFADTVLVSPGTTLPDSYAQAIDQLNSLGFSRPPG
jgi:hypothetical protein